MKYCRSPLVVFLVCCFASSARALHRFRGAGDSAATTLRGGGGDATATSVEQPRRPPRQMFVKSMLAGGSSRAVAQMVLYPVDALRTLAQTRDGRTLADVGAKALIRGSITTSSFALFMGAIQFSVFGFFRHEVGPLAASALGAAASCLVSVPQEVIKQRLVTGIYSSFGAAVRSIAREEGLSGFYSAWRPTMARNVPFVFITFSAQDWIKNNMLKQGNKQLTMIENALVGISAAFVAGVATNPIDVVKTRMMTQAASSQVPYSSALDCVRTVIKTEGVSTFYAGFKQRSTYMCLLWGVTFALNGKINQWLASEERREQKSASS